MVRFSLVFEGDKAMSQYTDYLKLSERYGFYSFQVYEHITFRPAWAICFHIARFAENIRLGPVTIPVMLYHPAYIAANIAALDEVTDGKAILGLSRGAFYEYLSTTAKRPIAAVNDAVRIIDMLLKGDGGYEGSIFKISSRAKLKTNTAHSVEIYVGSSGPKMIQMASGLKPVKAIVVDNLWNPRYAEKVRENIRLGALGAGRRPEEVSVIARPFCSIMSNREEARRIVIKELSRYMPSLVANSPMLEEAGISFADLEALTVKQHGSEELVSRIIDNFSATGTPDDVIEQTDRLVKAGITHICYGHPLGKNIEESIRLIGDKVKPYFEQR